MTNAPNQGTHVERIHERIKRIGVAHKHLRETHAERAANAAAEKAQRVADLTAASTGESPP
jgi:hypothetical protein